MKKKAYAPEPRSVRTGEPARCKMNRLVREVYTRFVKEIPLFDGQCLPVLAVDSHLSTILLRYSGGGLPQSLFLPEKFFPEEEVRWVQKDGEEIDFIGFFIFTTPVKEVGYILPVYVEEDFLKSRVPGLFKDIGLVLRHKVKIGELDPKYNYTRRKEVNYCPSREFKTVEFQPEHFACVTSDYQTLNQIQESQLQECGVYFPLCRIDDIRKHFNLKDVLDWVKPGPQHETEDL